MQQIVWNKQNTTFSKTAVIRTGISSKLISSPLSKACFTAWNLAWLADFRKTPSHWGPSKNSFFNICYKTSGKSYWFNFANTTYDNKIISVKCIITLLLQKLNAAIMFVCLAKLNREANLCLELTSWALVITQKQSLTNIPVTNITCLQNQVYVYLLCQSLEKLSSIKFWALLRNTVTDHDFEKMRQVFKFKKKQI